MVWLACAFFLGLHSPAEAATQTVVNADDAGSGSLRAVVAAADAEDTIVFDSGLSGQTISLTSGAIAIDKSLTIDGPGASQITIDAGHASRIFTLTAGNLSISDLTLADGAAVDNGGAIHTESTGSLTVSECTFTGNTAGGPGGSADESNLGHGGAIFVSQSSGSTTVSDSTFSANAAGGPGGTGFQSGLGSGGAIWDGSEEALTVSGSTFTGNTAGGNGDGGVQSGNGAGAAIQKSGGLSLTVSDSEFTGNTAGGAGGSEEASGRGRGGAIYISRPDGQAPSLAVSDSTFSDNAAGGAGGDGPISGIGEGGAIEHFSEGPLTVSGATFEGNSAGGAGGAGGVGFILGPATGSGGGFGGAVFVAQFASSTSISGSVFTANTAGGDGGSGGLSGRGEGGAIKGESGTGPVTVTASTFSGNVGGGAKGVGNGSGGANGGAINSFSSLTVTNSTFTANAAGGQGEGGSGGAFGFGGAIHYFNNVSPLTVSGSTFTANTAGGDGGAGNGGAIRASDVSPQSAFITNSTLVGNTAGGGGAIGRGGAIEVKDMSSVTLASVTISGNAVGAGGTGAGINSATDAIGSPATVTARATIISGNTGATNCDVPVTSSSYSLEGPSAGDTSCGFDLPSADPELEPLADNGGPTETQALPESSPAVDAVPATACPTSVDQRGEPRPDYDKPVCDVGAYELQGPLVAPAIVSGAAATFQVGESGSFAIEATGVPRPSLSQAGALPGGVGFTDNGDGTASLSGTPAAGTEGDYPITIEASNGVSPDATQSFILTVTTPEPPDDSAEPPKGPNVPPTPAIDLSLSLEVEQGSLRRLRRSGRLIVTTRVNKAARVALTGWARLGARARSSARTTLVPVLERTTVRFGQAGEERVALRLTRSGRRMLRRLRRVRLVITGSANDKGGARTKSQAVVLLTSRPRVVVFYRQTGGIGGPRPSLVVLGTRRATVTLGRCQAKFKLSRRAWRRLRAALRNAEIGAIAGNYPPLSGAADVITYVIKTRAGTVRITPASQADYEEVIRALRPLLNELDRTVAAGQRRMQPSCKSSRS